MTTPRHKWPGVATSVLALGLLTVPGLPRPLALVAGLGYAVLSVPLLLLRAPTATPVGLLGLALSVHWVTAGQAVRALVASAALFVFLLLAASVVDDTPVVRQTVVVGLVGTPVIGTAVWALCQHLQVTGLFWWTVGVACLFAAYALSLPSLVTEPHDLPRPTGDDGVVPEGAGAPPRTHARESARWQ